jgi:hypothetical protein
MERPAWTRLPTIGLSLVAVGLVIVVSQAFGRGSSPGFADFVTPTLDAQGKITICHAAGLEGTTHFETITIAPSAVFGPGGHFNENGTTQAGHEEDYFGPCSEEETVETPTSTPTTQASDTPTQTATSGTNTPTATATSQTATATATQTATEVATATPTTEVATATNTPLTGLAPLVVPTNTPVTVVGGAQGGGQAPTQEVAGVQQQAPTQGVAGVQQLPSTGAGSAGRSDALLFLGLALMGAGAALAMVRRPSHR